MEEDQSHCETIVSFDSISRVSFPENSVFRCFGFKITLVETSLMIQWLRLLTPNTGGQVQSLVREVVPTYHN